MPLTEGVINFTELNEILLKKNICEVLIEAGGKLNASMMKEKLVDEMNIFICPSVIIDDNGINVFDSFALEEIENSMQFKLVNTKEFDNDVLHKYTLLSSPGI